MSYKVTMEDLSSITDVELAFATERLLPPWEAIPQEFKDGNRYTALAEAIFYGRPLQDMEMHFLPGFDDEAAPAALNKCVRAHLQSYSPKHQHKIAGVGYLMAQVFRLEEAKVRPVKPAGEGADW